MRHVILLLFLVNLTITGCDVVEDRIGERQEATATVPPFSTATPGGQISVWMISPSGEENPNLLLSGENPGGQMVGPAATATAAIERIISATQTAAAPTPQPDFQTGECPAYSPIPSPAKPPNFADYPAVTGVYLSNGGAPSVLESTLRGWNAVTDRGGAVQADTDLTGDSIPEVLILLFNPDAYNPEAILNTGRLLIYGCENRAYRLLYATPDNTGLALPVLHRVGDMNGDARAELVFDIQTCTLASCTREGFILTWNPVVGAFEPLNIGQIFAVNGRLGVVDIEGDGILELTARSILNGTAASGPARGVIDVWDWTGLNYVLATRIQDEPRYRIHLLQDADGELLAGNTREAVRLYQEARDSENLMSWTIPNESILLRAYTQFRLVTAHVRLGNGQRAEQALAALLAENPAGTPGASYAVLANAFMEVIRRGENSTAACQAALTQVAVYPETLSILNSYGTENRKYQINELCPF